MLLAFTVRVLSRACLLLSLSLLPPIAYAAARALFHREPPYLAGVLLMVEHLPFFAIGLPHQEGRQYGARSPVHRRAADNGRGHRGRRGLPFARKGVVAAFSAAVFYAVATGRLRWIARGPLVFLGTISKLPRSLSRLSVPP
jgi:hypothetical protein